MNRRNFFARAAAAIAAVPALKCAPALPDELRGLSLADVEEGEAQIARGSYVTVDECREFLHGNHTFQTLTSFDGDVLTLNWDCAPGDSMPLEVRKAVEDGPMSYLHGEPDLYD